MGYLASWETGAPPGSQYGGSASSAPATKLPVSDVQSYMTIVMSPTCTVTPHSAFANKKELVDVMLDNVLSACEHL